MTTYTATYSPDDNKLRLTASSRLDAETYARVKAAGFRWAPRQDLFFAPKWTPGREDLLIELAGEIEDEDKTLSQRAEERADRFETYSEKRGTEAKAARDRVKLWRTSEYWTQRAAGGRQLAKELSDMLDRGPSLGSTLGNELLRADEARQRVISWLDTWIKPLVRALVPELKGTGKREGDGKGSKH